MANINLPIEFYGAYPGVGVFAARIRRFDGLVYDPSDGTFKTESLIKTAFLPLAQGTGNNQTLRSATINMNPVQFIDGDYFTYFHDMLSPVNMIVAQSQTSVFAGNWSTIRTPTAAEIAAGVFGITTSSNTTSGSYGGDWSLLMKQMNYLCQNMQAVTGKVFPS